MVGGHCIKAWSKTQSVIAKSSAESELYSVVKGACEGLGLITLFADFGDKKGVKLNLDATAAKGILERQGIAKVRHIDVNVLWLQQQLAKKIIPLIKVDGTVNCSDLMTKHLASQIILKHVAYLNLEFREGRAGKAVQLHSMERLEPQGEFREGEEPDRWEERGEQGRWVRLHRSPRITMFTPHKIPNGPGRKTRLSVIRQTIGIDEGGRHFDVSDDWTQRVDAHRALSTRWTGITIFTTQPHDDLQFGGDQRRQRARVSWADLSDS